MPPSASNCLPMSEGFLWKNQVVRSLKRLKSLLTHSSHPIECSAVSNAQHIRLLANAFALPLALENGFPIKLISNAPWSKNCD